MLKTHSLHNSTIRVKMGVCSFCKNDKKVPLIAGKCSSHYWKSKTKASEPKKHKPIKKVADKRKKEIVMYLKARLDHLNENPNCEVCGLSATEIHHKRGKIGKLLYDKRYFMSVDRMCHDKIENNPEWAKEQNYSVSRL
ncbi:hypothetical protein [Sphingobacterium faecium]|uniref:hypothetical protein n=1 Tax=Sphingobacterium faecium TaxID=34087 RepID=UPI00247A50CA|nr:hypothetical protein [Sphingobacterium faecium]WGQ15607.1 hypothetical protein QG727_04175 [Sphingobacterium faecium]